MIYIAGLQNVSGDVLEAAKIDGAGKLQALFRVTLPMMMPSITICLFLTISNSFKMFDQNLALTGGGPSGKTTIFFALLRDGTAFFRKFSREKAGFTSIH